MACIFRQGSARICRATKWWGDLCLVLPAMAVNSRPSCERGRVTDSNVKAATRACLSQRMQKSSLSNLTRRSGRFGLPSGIQGDKGALRGARGPKNRLRLGASSVRLVPFALRELHDGSRGVGGLRTVVPWPVVVASEHRARESVPGVRDRARTAARCL